MTVIAGGFWASDFWTSGNKYPDSQSRANGHTKEREQNGYFSTSFCRFGTFWGANIVAQHRPSHYRQ
jgi:hypothetical protein